MKKEILLTFCMTGTVLLASTIFTGLGNAPALSVHAQENKVQSESVSGSAIVPAGPETVPQEELTLLPAVTGVSAKKDKSLKAAVLTWTAYPGAVNYEIHAKAGQGAYAKIATTGATTSYTATGLKAGETYHFIVVAVINRADGRQQRTMNSAVAAVKLKPGKVKKFKAKALRGKIRLSWKRGGNINGYQIQRKVHIKIKGFKPKYTHLKTIKSAKKTAITNVMLVSGMRYSYRIRTFKVVSKGKRVYGDWTTINKKKAR